MSHDPARGRFPRGGSVLRGLPRPTWRPGDGGADVEVLTPAEVLLRREGTAVVVFEQWSPGLADTVSEHVWGSALTVLPVCFDGSTVLVGPLLRRGAPVCLGCAEAARLATVGGRTPRSEPGVALGGAAVPALAGLLGELVDAVLAAAPGVGADPGAVLAVRSHDGTCSTHRPRPRGEGCTRCAPLPVDSPDGASFRPPGPLPVEGATVRGANPRATLARLRGVLHDWRFGPVAHVSRAERGTPAMAAAEVVADWTERDGGYGRAMTYAQAERIALFEAVERMTGMNPRGRRTALRASFDELGPDRALDPRTLGEHEPGHVADPGFLLTPYAPDVPTTWVYGWSVTRQAPLAVPEHVAYWGGSSTRRSERAGRPPSAVFVGESSNGCGLGGSLEEAALYALFEIAERDAFLMAWYTRARLESVAVPVEDPLVAHQCDRLDALGYDISLFDVTNDLGVPAVMSLAVCRDTGSPAPQAFFAGGAHHDPIAAIRSAVAETAVNVVQSASVALARPDYFDRARLRPMITCPRLVAGLDDHVGLATLPEARPRYRHLLDAAAGASRPWTEVWGPVAPVTDIGTLLSAVTDRFVAAGVDVVLVDQSDPALTAELGVHAVKAVVPGSIPMTFGELNRRTRGLPRLLEVPWRLGRLDAAPSYADLPLDPHPFP